jgi:hypothetical protein
MIAINSITTCYNYGALLQSWSLQQTIRSLGNDSPVHIELRKKNLNLFKNFIKGHLNKNRNSALERRHYSAWLFKELLLPHLTIDKWSELKFTKIKGIIVGSDEVLSPTNHTNPLMRGLLPHKLHLPVFGYALSAGGDRNIHSCKQAGFNPYGFQTVGVRDQSAAGLFLETGRKPILNLDPVFLPDEKIFKKLEETVTPNASITDIIDKPYILVYSDTPLDQLHKLSNQFSFKHRLVILGNLEANSIQQQQINSRNDIYILDNLFPINMIPYLFKRSTGVVTNFFHGIALSIRYEKPFHFLRNPMKSFKVDDLLINMNMHRLIDNPMDISDRTSWSKIYANSRIRRSELRDMSLEYLQSVIGSIS